MCEELGKGRASEGLPAQETGWVGLKGAVPAHETGEVGCVSS